MKTNTSQKLLQFLKAKKQATAKELGEHLGISRQALFKHHLAPSLKGQKITKTGRPPKVFYSLANAKHGCEELAFKWVEATKPPPIPPEYYCATRDEFQSRLDKMTNSGLKQKSMPEDRLYLLTAMAGEIGNNSFDHNLGQWRDVPGIFFAYDFKERIIVLADRGQGVWATLKKIRPKLKNDEQALKTAFTEKISGRAPEQRGNGLKFVKNGIASQNMQMSFLSGSAKAELEKEISLSGSNKNIKGCLAIIKF